MKDVLQHPLGPLPWSLANCDGSMKKTNKAVMARKLESMAAPAEVIPQPSACIIDAMSLIQKINGENLTFVEVSDHLLTTVLKLCGECDRVDVVFDIYKQLSIKDAERALRASMSSPGIRFTNIVPGHKIKQWRRLLSCGESKKQLISFIANQWKDPVQRQQLNNKVVYVTCGEICTKITSDGGSRC